MSRPERITLDGYVYHVLNRANGRLRKGQKKYPDTFKFPSEYLEKYVVSLNVSPYSENRAFPDFQRIYRSVI